MIFFSISGVSRKTQELYAIVFLARYLDLFTDFISVYNTFMKIVFIASSLAIVWCMRVHPMVKRSYDQDLDTFRHYLLVAASFLLALVLHEKFTFLEVPFYLWILCFSFLKYFAMLMFELCDLTVFYLFILHLHEHFDTGKNWKKWINWIHSCVPVSDNILLYMSDTDTDMRSVGATFFGYLIVEHFSYCLLSYHFYVSVSFAFAKAIRGGVVFAMIYGYISRWLFWLVMMTNFR